VNSVRTPILFEGRASNWRKRTDALRAEMVATDRYQRAMAKRWDARKLVSFVCWFWRRQPKLDALTGRDDAVAGRRAVIGIVGFYLPCCLIVHSR